MWFASADADAAVGSGDGWSDVLVAIASRVFVRVGWSEVSVAGSVVVITTTG